jgi:glyoxylase-like metal-dependent hydrolase (beta-lactamase superfamily II)
MKTLQRIAPEVGWLPISFVNVYFVGRPGEPWALIDAGIPGSASQIAETAEARFGAGTRPEAIYLTHAHFDHRGSALALARKWNVPIYAHRMELPYLTGASAFPPPDPTVGGAIAFLSRFLPSGGGDFGNRVQELPPENLPGLEGWRWTETPGHSPGHVSFFRPSDRVLIAGDAFATMDMDSWTGMLSAKQELARAGSPFNYDWDATRRSVQKLADLRPNVVGAGHGIPMGSPDLPDRLEQFAHRFAAPRHGRYAHSSAQVNENGVVSVPPAPFDPVPLVTAGALLLAGVALGSGYLEEKLRD